MWVVRSRKSLTFRGAEFELQCQAGKVGNLQVWCGGRNPFVSSIPLVGQEPGWGWGWGWAPAGLALIWPRQQLLYLQQESWQPCVSLLASLNRADAPSTQCRHRDAVRASTHPNQNPDRETCRSKKWFGRQLKCRAGRCEHKSNPRGTAKLTTPFVSRRQWGRQPCLKPSAVFIFVSDVNCVEACAKGWFVFYKNWRHKGNNNLLFPRA